MLRPFIRVARPDDWTGKLASVATGIVLLVLVLASLLARLPPAWVTASGERPLLVRMALVLFSVWMVVWLRAAVYSRLPAAAFAVGSRLVFPSQGKHRMVRIKEIADIHVERRPEPAGEVFVVTLRDGSTRDVCPVAWEGAGRLYRHVARRVA